MNIRAASISVCLLYACFVSGQEKEVRIGVLGLFHPKEVVISNIAAKPLSCAAGSERWAVREPLHVRLEAASMHLSYGSETPTEQISCDDGQTGAADFQIAVPGKLSRSYHGKLDIASGGAELVVIVKMDIEMTVASVVAAESPPHAPLEALKAQAVAARSFLIAGKGRHRNFDFCDTTHCQFLREPPAAGSLAAQAARATRGLVLAYKGETFAAMYSASCGGRTHSLEGLGIATSGGYPYFAVKCDYCHRHPEKWVTRLSEADANGLAPTESSRIRLARKLGWKTVPGNSYSSRTEDGEIILEGTGVGHGIGLCQRGGADMARKGAAFQQILEHYYPNTELKQY